MNAASEPIAVDSAHEDPEVVRVLEWYLAEIEAGRTPDRASVLREHPRIAGELADCLDGLEFLRQSAEPERRLGRYRLVREIGRGGMGTVYEAEEAGTARRVAVKVLPPVAAGDAELKRFRHEIRAASALDHPHIVPIEAVGEEDGTHFFAMKLIDGGSLADWNARGAASTRPRRAEATSWPREPSLRSADTTISYHEHSRDPRALARIAEQAADALAHAHAHGIVHRDVKPANLLLAADGQLWVADFGLAFVPGATRLTRSSALVGTLRYMAPEQVEPRRGAVDHRVDQYGLGATLYELLTGRPVFDDVDRGSLIAKIVTVEPSPPRRLDPAIPFDLETIVLTLIAKDPAKRYPSMRAAADDLRRWLDSRPIHARRPSFRERAGSWLARHRRAAGMLGVAATGAAILLIGNQFRLQRERDRTRSEREIARAAVDDFWSTYSESVLDRMPERDPRTRELLEKALAYYSRLTDESDRLPAARAHRRVAEIHRRLGSDGESIRHLNEAARLLSETNRMTEDIVRECGVVANERGNLHRAAGRFDDAGRDYRRAARDFQSLIEGGSKDPFDFGALAGIENNQGLLWQSLNRSIEAEACFRAARARFAKLAIDRRVFLLPAAQASHNLAEILVGKGRLADADVIYLEAAELADGARANDPRAPNPRREAARIALRRAENLALIGQNADSRTVAWEACREWSRLASEHPDVVEFSIGAAHAIRVWSLASIPLAANGESGQDVHTGRIGEP
jgi:eukaryotic-like serine/threonine-protein kinase